MQPPPTWVLTMSHAIESSLAEVGLQVNTRCVVRACGRAGERTCGRADERTCGCTGGRAGGRAGRRAWDAAFARAAWDAAFAPPRAHTCQHGHGRCGPHRCCCATTSSNTARSSAAAPSSSSVLGRVAIILCT
jgi:hypothetical protein